MRIGITGANGFLGKHLITSCIAADLQVEAFVRPSANISEIADHKNLTIHKVDYKELGSYLKRVAPLDYFIHNAAVTVSLNQAEYFSVNTTLTAEVLDALKSSKALSNGKFVLISSYAANGPLNAGGPVSDYGRSKLQAEEKIQEYGLNHLIVRPTGIYGPGDAAFLPLFKLAKRGVYPLSAPQTQKVTMIHGLDLAKGIVSSMKDMSGVLHFSDGNTYSHQDLRSSLQKVFKRKVRNIKLPKSLAILSLKVANLFDKILRERPSLTAEKFDEISQDWNLIDDEQLKHANIKCEFDIDSGFQDTYLDYKKKNLL